MQIKNTAKAIFSVFFGGLVFFAAAYFYLSAGFGASPDQIKADTKDPSIPYSPASPDNAGLLMVFPDNSASLIYLDFYSMQICISVIDSVTDGTTEYFGYAVSHTFFADYELLSGIIDRVGGLELELEGKLLRYTGIQLTDFLSRKNADTALKKQIISAIFEKISKNGFSRDDLVYIIENSETDLTLPDCFEWPELLAEMALRVTFIN